MESKGALINPRHNRGPSVAAANKQAIITAARVLFAERGYLVPLSAIARASGVSQGVLYRHFPTRLSLALTVFEDNFVELRRLAASSADDALWPFWTRILELTVSEVAFVELALHARDDSRSENAGEELRALLEPLLVRAQATGLASADLTLEDVLLTQRMIYGIVLTAGPGEDLDQHVERLCDSLRN